MKVFSLTFLLFLIASTVVSSQSLESFIEEKQAGLEYDEAKLVQVPGTNVKMIPPEYFQVDAGIKGFVHPGSACTIQVVEIQGISHETIENSMTEEHIANQGYVYKEKIITQTRKGKRAACFVVSFVSEGIEYERIMMFTGDENTIWVNANYPVELKKLLFPAIEAALLSVE